VTTSSTTTAPNRVSTQGKDQQVIVGIKQDLQTMSSLPLGGQTYTPSSLVAFIQSRIDAANAVLAAKANWLNASKTYEAIDTQATVVVRELRNLVIGAFGASSPKLADFGFTPTKRKVQTPEEKAAAAVKRKATRVARGTLGKVQKLSIHGAPTPAPSAAASAPATSPTVPAPTPQPAPAPAAQAPAPTTPAVAAPVAPAPAPAAPTAPAAAATPAHS
jgi:hypothetical protein